MCSRIHRNGAPVDSNQSSGRLTGEEIQNLMFVLNDNCGFERGYGDQSNVFKPRTLQYIA